jgi:hypothetical protein
VDPKGEIADSSGASLARKEKSSLNADYDFKFPLLDWRKVMKR